MAKRRPVAFVCVIDVSGSMGSAVGAGEAGSGMAYSRLDLVKHVLNVLIACLKDQDKLALISFSDQAELVMGLTPMTKMNKNLAKTAVQVLTPQMNTYMGPAIKKAYDVFGEASLSANYLKSIILLTDGQVCCKSVYIII
jgi:Ca-activated chloride channel family protein